MKIENKNELYIMNQPVHKLLSIVVMDCLPEKDDELHNSLDQLSEVGDIVFVYSQSHFQIESNKRKFTNLYRGCGYIDSEGLNLGYSIFKTLSYFRELYGHVGFSVSLLSAGISKIAVENIIKLMQSSIIRPVFKIRRLNRTELFEIYSKKEDSSIKSQERLKLMNWKRLPKQEVEDCIHCTHFSESKLFYINGAGLNHLLLKFKNEDGDLLEYIKTFQSKSNPMYLLASYVKKCGLDNLEVDVENLKVNDLSGKLSG